MPLWILFKTSERVTEWRQFFSKCVQTCSYLVITDIAVIGIFRSQTVKHLTWIILQEIVKHFNLSCEPFKRKPHKMVKHSQTIRQVSRQMQVAIDKLSYQPEKLYTEALLEVLSKTIAEEINAVLKKRMYGMLWISSASSLLLPERPTGKSRS